MKSAVNRGRKQESLDTNSSTISVGLVANPVSARDIRRVIANATSLQVADRANIVMRVLAAVRSCGVKQVLMMPENGGICRLLKRGLQREQQQGDHQADTITVAVQIIDNTKLNYFILKRQ